MSSATLLTTIVGLAPTLVILYWVKSVIAIPVNWRLIALCVGLGMLSAIPVALTVLPIKYLGAGLDQPIARTLYRAFVSASLLEETLKFAGLILAYFAARLRHTPALLIIAGTATSLGFATFENILYVADEGLSTALIRAFTAIPCHACLGTIMGYYFARAQMLERKSELFKAWLIPLILHGMYDFPLMAGFSGVLPEPDGMTILLSMLALVLLVMWARYILFHLRYQVSFAPNKSNSD
jgi:RsiW-degrading membrane proteinase PrsW (M82 family)